MEVFPILLYVVLTTMTTGAEGLYAGLGRRRPDVLPPLEYAATWLTICAWFHAYAARHRIPLIMDFGWLLGGAWLLAVPYYLFRTQGWRALVPIGAYILLLILFSSLNILVSWAVSSP